MRDLRGAISCSVAGCSHAAASYVTYVQGHGFWSGFLCQLHTQHTQRQQEAGVFRRLNVFPVNVRSALAPVVTRCESLTGETAGGAK